MAGMMATSTSPRRNASAHCEGTVNDRSYLPARGPSVKPHTSGAVFRYSTMEMRNLAMSESQKKKRILNIAQRQFVKPAATIRWPFGNLKASEKVESLTR